MTDVDRHDLTPQSRAQVGVAYSEIISWAVWLQVFTAVDLADAMGVSEEIAERGMRALMWHGICYDTGDLSSAGGRVLAYVPLPPGPTEHPTEAPEWKTCVQDLVPPHRGMPIRLIDNTRRRDQMQGTGGARVRIRQRDKAYEAMQVAKEERRDQQADRARRAAEGKENKQKGKTTTHEVDRKGKIS